MADLKQFTKDALRTESTVESIELNGDVLKSILEIFIASGNLLDMAKKNAFYNKKVNDFDYVKRMKEIENAMSNIQTDGEKDYITYYSRLTDNKSELIVNPRLFHGIVGIATEATEMVEALIPAMNGEEVDWVNVAEEMGDISWYEAILFDEIKLDWDVCLDTVISKLKVRFPECYTDDKAINRNLNEERKVLEEELGKVGC